MKIAFFGDSLTKGIPGASYFEILRKQLANHTLLNYGRSGDTVRAAYQVVTALPPGATFDIAFLWIGTNDVYHKALRTFPLARQQLGRPWINSRRKFTRTYGALLNHLSGRTIQLFAVSPWFVGEDVHNPWNQELDMLTVAAQSLCTGYQNASFIDLRTQFRPRLPALESDRYLAGGAVIVARDLLRRRSGRQINDRGAQRGLRFTVDGVHLNDRGAEIVANTFAGVIKQR